MKPGRELDALVAEILGWKRWPDKHDRIVMSPPDMTYGAQFDQHPGYSTDDALALTLVPIVLEDWNPSEEPGYGQEYEGEFRAVYHPDWENGGPRWWAAFGVYYDWEDAQWLYEAFAPTLAEAICLAVLKTDESS